MNSRSTDQLAHFEWGHPPGRAGVEEARIMYLVTVLSEIETFPATKGGDTGAVEAMRDLARGALMRVEGWEARDDS